MADAGKPGLETFLIVQARELTGRDKRPRTLVYLPADLVDDRLKLSFRDHPVEDELIEPSRSPPEKK